MISFDKPRQFDGVQLCDELEAEGIAINRETSPRIDDNDVFWLDIDTVNAQKAQDVINKHKPKPRVEPTIEEKLATVGLSLDDLKAALGL